MKQIIAVAAIKGGTGKTTTAGALAQAAVKDGKRVLAIDLDPQSNLSMWHKADFKKPGSYEMLTGSKPPKECIQKTESGIYLAAGSANLSGIQTGNGSAHRLENAIDAIKRNYDFIIIDTGPALGETQNNALFAATSVIIPLEAAIYSLQALYQIAGVISHIQESKPTLKALGVVITQYNGRANVDKFMQETIKEQAAVRSIPYLGEIRKGIAVEEAEAYQQTLFDYAPKSKPAADYLALYNRIMEGAK